MISMMFWISMMSVLYAGLVFLCGVVSNKNKHRNAAGILLTLVVGQRIIFAFFGGFFLIAAAIAVKIFLVFILFPKVFRKKP